MRNSYLKIFVGIIVSLYFVYFIQEYLQYKNKYKQEAFTPKINSLYRPHIRTINQIYETFISNYGPNVILTKLRKWNIY